MAKMARNMIPLKSSGNVFSSYIVNIVVEPPNWKKTNKLDHFPKFYLRKRRNYHRVGWSTSNLTHGTITMCRSCLNQNPLCNMKLQQELTTTHLGQKGSFGVWRCYKSISQRATTTNAKITNLEYLQISSSFQCSFICDDLVPIRDSLSLFKNKYYWWILLYISKDLRKHQDAEHPEFFVEFHALFGATIKGD